MSALAWSKTLKSIFLSIGMLVAGCALTGESGNLPFLETRWNLQQLVSEDIEYSGSEVPYLRFETERVTGNDGCNNFFGPYKQDNNSLTFGLLASTRMACPQLEGFDLMFHKMLIQTTRYRVSGSRLELYANDKLIARFVATEQS